MSNDFRSDFARPKNEFDCLVVFFFKLGSSIYFYLRKFLFRFQFDLNQTITTNTIFSMPVHTNNLLLAATYGSLVIN